MVMQNVLNEADFNAWVATSLQQVEGALDGWVGQSGPQDLAQAMRYAVLDGGKRLRPLLVLAVVEAVQGSPEAGLRAACAVELIHAYSLVHDDMPCMDNDMLRRGKPTVHVKFGEAGALLAGDALQALAFELLCPRSELVPAPMQAKLCRMLAQAAGSNGMAGGQAIDLASVGIKLDEARLRRMHELKTGALLHASVMMGGATADLTTQMEAGLSTYGKAIGLAFQVVDDILDVTADSATLGKTAGKDAAADKPTYVSLLGLDGAKRCAQEQHQQALQGLVQSGLQQCGTLEQIANWVIGRAY
jgi:farnesyl diphosphate synthase